MTSQNSHLLPKYNDDITNKHVCLCVRHSLIPNSEELMDYENLPSWYQYNKHINTAYRKPHESFSYFTLSIFKIHNETFNIWSHLLGVFLFIGILIYNNVPVNVDAFIDNISVNIFISTVIICFSLSTLMHTYFPKSKLICENLARLDYSGIALLISGSYVPFVYYTFYCYRNLRILYFSILGGLILIAIPILCNLKLKRLIRTGIYISLGLFGAMPILHKFIVMGTHKEEMFLTELFLIGIVVFLYIIGVALYNLHFPEIVHKELFNVYFSSHQLFHFFTVLGALAHYFAIEYSYKKHIGYNCD